jgi:hypothetical protein
MMTVGGKLILDVNVIQSFAPVWVVANIAFGLVFVPGQIKIPQQNAGGRQAIHHKQ